MRRPGVPLAEEDPPLAAQVPVQGELDSLHPLAVQVGEADEGRGQFPVRVERFGSSTVPIPSTADGFRGLRGRGRRAPASLPLPLPPRRWRASDVAPTRTPSPCEQLPELLGGTGYPGARRSAALSDRAASPAGRRSISWRCSPRARFPSGPGSHPAWGGGDGGAVLLRAAVTDLPYAENLDLERPCYDEDVEGEKYAEDEARAGSHLTGSPGPSVRAPCADRCGRWHGCGRALQRQRLQPENLLLLLKGALLLQGGGTRYPVRCTVRQPDVEKAGDEKGQEQATNPRRRGTAGPPAAPSGSP